MKNTIWGLALDSVPEDAAGFMQICTFFPPYYNIFKAIH